MQLKKSILFYVALAVFLAWGGCTSQIRNFSSSDSHKETEHLLARPRVRRDYSSMENCVRGMGRNQIVTPVTVPETDDQVPLCDTKTDGGGWIVIQRRVKGIQSFNKNWRDYKSGFGTGSGDYWLGNEILHSLTTENRYQMRVDMEYKGKKYYARYNTFVVFSEASGYKLLVDGHSGTANNAMTGHNHQKFSTYDRDNDVLNNVNCADKNRDGWWYSSCIGANLNAPYFNSLFDFRQRFTTKMLGIYWRGITPLTGPFLKKVEMKIRKSF